MPIFERDGSLHSRKFIKFITNLITIVQFWRGNIAALHLYVLWRTLMLSGWHCKEAPVNQHGIARRSVPRILKSDLNLYPHKMTVLPKLTVQNKHQRMAFAEWAQNNEVSFCNVWFPDEAHFHLFGVVNKKTCNFWHQRIHL
jgi:hypothetical protein